MVTSDCTVETCKARMVLEFLWWAKGEREY